MSLISIWNYEEVIHQFVQLALKYELTENGKTNGNLLRRSCPQIWQLQLSQCVVSSLIHLCTLR